MEDEELELGGGVVWVEGVDVVPADSVVVRFGSCMTVTVVSARVNAACKRRSRAPLRVMERMAVRVRYSSKRCMFALRSLCIVIESRREGCRGIERVCKRKEILQTCPTTSLSNTKRSTIPRSAAAPAICIFLF